MINCDWLVSYITNITNILEQPLIVCMPHDCRGACAAGKRQSKPNRKFQQEASPGNEDDDLGEGDMEDSE